MYSFEPIACIYNDFDSKFGIPRQSGMLEGIESRIVFTEKYRVREAFRGLEEYSHIWLLWIISEHTEKEWSPTVRPPRLGGNIRKGVFATRSPFRPNPVGLSCVKLEKIDMESPDGPVLIVSGADLKNETPIIDIKPYIPYWDSFPDAKSGFAKEAERDLLQVVCEKEIPAQFPEDKKQALFSVLSMDPRPAYQNDPDRIYGFSFSGYEIRFFVTDKILTIVDISKARS